MKDVLIVGGGPVGLFLAGELRLGGLEPVLMEQNVGAKDRNRSFGQRAISGRTAQTLTLRGLAPALETQNQVWIEQLEDLGLMSDVADAALIAIQGMRDGSSGGHFGMFPLRSDGANSDRCYVMKQHMLEQLLEDWATALGVQVQSSAQVVAVRDEGDHAVAELTDGRSISARYIVGCDGGRSTVRKSAGFDFVGTPATMTGRIAYAELDDPNKACAVFRGPNGLVNCLMVPGEIITYDFDGTGPTDRDAPVTVEEMEASMLRGGGVDEKIGKFTGGTRFTDNTRQVDMYRRGRILVAGDAAHVHSPMGGQGLNLGIQDAANIGWKMALVVNGCAPESLLDTYTAERHPVVAKVLRSTRAQMALTRPGPQVDALREIIGEIIGIPPVHDYFAALVSNENFGYAPDSKKPLVGYFVPKELRAVASDNMTDGRFLLLDLVGSQSIREVVDTNDRVRYLHKEISYPGVDALLIRPDGYVTWVSLNANSDGLAETIQQWGVLQA